MCSNQSLDSKEYFFQNSTHSAPRWPRRVRMSAQLRVLLFVSNGFLMNS